MVVVSKTFYVENYRKDFSESEVDPLMGLKFWGILRDIKWQGNLCIIGLD